MIGSTTILTATYNKEIFLPDAIESVLSQTRPIWRWWIVLDGANSATIELVNELTHKDYRVTSFIETVNANERFKSYRPSIIANKYLPLINTDYLCWLSDDDILSKDYLEVLAGALDNNQDWDVVYGHCQVKHQVGTTNQWVNGVYLGTLPPGIAPACNCDGGQILQTKHSYNKVKEHWKFPTEIQCQISDGLYLNELVKHYEFHPIDKLVLTHRTTHLSEACRWKKE